MGIRNLVILFIFLMPGAISGNIAAQNARQFYRTGVTFVEAGNHKDAIDQFTRALNLDPQYTPAYIERARSYEAINDLQHAADDLKRALAFEQKEPELYFDAARIHFALGNYPEAQELIDRSISLDRRSDASFRLLARIQMALEDYSGSLITINRAIDMKDNAENYFYRGQLSEHMKNYRQAETDYKEAISQKEQYNEALLALASLSIRLNKPRDALIYCNTVINSDPAHREALLIRSRIFANLTEFPSAIDDISKILAGNPEDKEMYLLRGSYYQEFTQHQQAINDFSKTLLIDPKYSEAIHKRAYSYEQVGDFKSAIKDYEKLIALSSDDMAARQHLDNAQKRLFELNREPDPPTVALIEPPVDGDSTLKIARNKKAITVRGRVTDESDIAHVTVNKKPATIFHNGDQYEFAAEIDILLTDLVSVQARDVYGNVKASNYNITRTEIDPPAIAILAPYASDNGEIYLDTDNASLYIEGTITDESTIKSIIIDGVTASFTLDELNPTFTATINVANKNKFNVTASDTYGNDTTVAFVLNREGISLLEANPMGRTWVVFIENSNYETFPSLEGPSNDVALMRSALSGYDIHKIIHKQDMTKKEMERFFSIELRDLLRSNKVNSLMIWYAGHGKFENETGYWVPADAQREDEFTYYNLNALRASLQSYSLYITHNLVITDACESGPTFSMVMREVRKERNCNDWEAVKFKSSQVFSSAGYELAVDNSQFTKTFASTLENNADACIPVESIVNKVSQAVTQSNRQTPQFGKIVGLEDEDGTFFFMSKGDAVIIPDE